MFEVTEKKGYGDGRLADVEIENGVADDWASYAKITAIDELDGRKISIGDTIIGKAGAFVAGADILLHVSTSTVETDYLGKYKVARILLANNGILTLDCDFTDFVPRDQFDFYGIQAVLALQFDCLTLKAGGVLAPNAYDPYKMCGGILFVKCYDSLKFEGGHIDLASRGIPANYKHLLRPLTTQETAANGEGDVARYAGQENFITADKFLLNAGDGALMALSKEIFFNGESRIGNTATHGVRHCRGAVNSVGNKPAGITNIGGSTILMAADTLHNFNEKCIAKYRDATAYEGRGLCRCYIASNTPLRHDEGLYSYDVISDKNRLRRVLNIEGYGDGSNGSMTNPIKQLNNYAQVVNVSQGGTRLTLGEETRKGLTPLVEGVKVLVQKIPTGEFVLAKILRRDSTSIVIDFPAPAGKLQVISVPQYEDFKLDKDYSAVMKYNGKVGGVLALMVSGECDLSEGRLNVEGKGGAIAYGYAGQSLIGTSLNHSRLPLGEGHGSVFLVAKTLILNDNSRIGASYSGLGGESFGGMNSTKTNRGGGYSAAYDEEGTGYGGAYNYGGASNLDTYKNRHFAIPTGGIGANGKSFNGYKGGLQGAHIFAVTESVTGFTQAAFSTGGSGGKGFESDGSDGAAGYGGGSAKNGGSGGSSGGCFLYLNE